MSAKSQSAGTAPWAWLDELRKVPSPERTVAGVEGAQIKEQMFAIVCAWKAGRLRSGSKNQLETLFADSGIHGGRTAAQSVESVPHLMPPLPLW